MASVVVKSYLEMPDFSVETRRFVVELTAIDKDGIYDQIHWKVRNTFPDLKDKNFTLFWKDEDDDFVTVSTDGEIRDLLSNAMSETCKIFIKVCGDVEDQTVETGQDQNTMTGKKGDHEKQDPWVDMANQPGAFFAHPPPPPPPSQPFFGPHPHQSFGGPHGWRRGRGGWHQHQHGFGNRFPHHGMHRHHQGGRHHPHGHHPHGHHPHGHHPQGQQHCGRWGMHGGHQQSLREMVPMPHRRWAKGYIQSWRKENLKNTTTTTSDSEGATNWKISMADASVPQAYAEWLELKLIRWHKKWGADELGERGSEDETEQQMGKKAFNGLKTSVPKEFRKWTKRYLNTHFGRRDAPKFKKHQHGCGWNGDEVNKAKKLYAMVPREQRMWTKQFIRNWRIEKKLDDPNSPIPPSNDSEDCKSDVDDNGKFSVPEEYKQWLEMFLLRWHVWRSQLERTPEIQMRGGMGQFKGVVPMEYRAWVKHFMAMHYIRPNERPELCKEVEVDPVHTKYEIMLQVFQKKWIEMQQDLGSDSDNFLCVSSGEEETSKGEPEASFERMIISNENGCKKSKVKFEDQSAMNQKKIKKNGDYFLMSESDDEDPMSHQRKESMNPNFRRWAKHALRDWDGKTVGGDNSAEHGSDGEMKLSPKVYNWMSKMMMKMQMKKMKQQLKTAKREMKAAKKQEKHEPN